jgi:manganese/zinc/iron transport system ATP- binding protein
MKLNTSDINAISIKNFTIGYNNKPILSNVNLEIPAGVRCAIIGLNGSGKTTLLKGILELEKKTNGEILFFNKSLSSVYNKIAYVPQIKTIDWNFPILVENVVKMGCYNMNNFFSYTLSNDYIERINMAMIKMNLIKKKDSHINNLSGGEKQRVFIARAIAQNPELFILDEPLTGLDIKSELIITELFKELSVEKKTVISVHHDLYTLYNYFNWVIIVNKGIIYNGILDKNIVEPYIKEAFFQYL